MVLGLTTTVAATEMERGKKEVAAMAKAIVKKRANLLCLMSVLLVENGFGSKCRNGVVRKQASTKGNG